VMPTDNDGEATRGLPRPAVLTNQPIGQHNLPGRRMGNKRPLSVQPSREIESVILHIG
jgi:hypothetical protein